ncbi:MAG: glycosyltransferase family 9 protein, partial [Bacteroidales bacterium]
LNYVNFATNMAKKILIIQTASIGDVILVTPVAEALHQFDATFRIDLLIKKGYENLFEEHPYLNQVFTWEKNKRKYLNLFALIRQFRNEKYDWVINVQRFGSTGLITVLSGAKTSIGFDKNPFSTLFSIKVKHDIGLGHSHVHEAERNLKLIESITGTVKANPRLYPSKKHFEKVSIYKTKPYICIAPASLWFTKQFPEDQWINFLQAISGDLKVYLLGSRADAALCERIIIGSGQPEILSLAGRLNLPESAALMQDAKMNYVNDSAPLHLCSAVNARMTAIYCSTVPEFGFGPLADNAVIVQTNEKLACRPCGLHGWNQCPEKHFRCASTINTQELINRL